VYCVAQTEVRWKAESIVNEHLASDVLQLRNLVDAITTVSDICIYI